MRDTDDPSDVVSVVAWPSTISALKLVSKWSSIQSTETIDNKCTRRFRYRIAYITIDALLSYG